ncbi:MAG: hypothetical protein FJ285_04435 [Planctomycetes bacterium]|nr:hypothetical protein [Planctomycetota bacterium]
MQQLPPQSDGVGGPRVSPGLARVLLLLIALPLVTVLAIAGFALIAVFVGLAAVLLVIGLVRRALRGGATRPPSPMHDGEGRENVRVIRRD